MCGISLIVAPGRVGSDQLLTRLKQMNGSIVHRGPDDAGFYADAGVYLAHRRLSILDVSAAGKQPMSYAQRYWITYNGEIYNYLELKQQLQAKGYSFATATDTEVILAAYQEWGGSCVSRFNGMWALAIYDKLKNEVFLSRDRFGIKPMYYTYQGNQLFVGSEIKQLIRPGAAANMDRLSDFLLMSYSEHSSDTFFDEVSSFPAGHTALLRAGEYRIQPRRFYSLPDTSDDLLRRSEGSLQEEYDELFRSSVNLRLRSDVPVGSCLSGGLDSSSIVAIAAQGHPSFQTFTIRSSEKETDESGYARQVADHVGAEEHVLTPSFSDFSDNFSALVYAQEEPFASPSVFLQYNLMKYVRQSGVKVLLDGQGGDESLLGYERYFPVQLADKNYFSRFLIAAQIAKNSKLSYADVWKYYFYFTRAKLRSLERVYALKPFLNREIIHSHFRSSSLYKDYARSYSSTLSLQDLELSSTQLPHLLRYEDKNSMAHSVEARLPFLDYRLVEFSLKLPLSMKLRQGWTKYVLRNSVDKLLPKQVVWRKNKFGFQAPENSWSKQIRTNDEVKVLLRSSKILKEYVIDAGLSDQVLARLPTKLYWRMLSVAYWEKAYKVVV